MGSGNLEILLVDDDDADALLVRESLNELDAKCQLTVARDGDVALRRLSQSDEFEGVALPDLVLLDLNLPRKSGFDVLVDTREIADCRLVPIVVWSTSIEPADVTRCYMAGANSVLCKPADFSSLVEMIRTITHYWFETVQRAKPTQ